MTTNNTTKKPVRNPRAFLCGHRASSCYQRGLKLPHNPQSHKLARGYARLSTEEQARKSIASVKKQILYMESFANEHVEEGWNWDRSHTGYKDTGASESTFARSSFSEMMRDAEAGRFKILLVLDATRFGRNLRTSLDSLDKLYRWGVEVRAKKMPWLDYKTSEGKRGWVIALADAEFERGSCMGEHPSNYSHP